MNRGPFDIAEAQARLEAGMHEHETANRVAIDADWARRRAANPALFNGAAVLGTGWELADGRLSIACRRIDYATLVHWLSTPGPNAEDGAAKSGGAVHFFTNAVITGRDGKVVMGRMADHTFNAGRIYMPSGSFEPDDFVDGLADFGGNMRREVAEETGIDLDEAEAAPGYSVVTGRGQIAFFRNYRFEVPSKELAEQARDWLSGGGDGELAEILTFAPGETHAAMPSHVQLFMRALAK